LYLPGGSKREILVRDEEETDPAYGKPPYKRSIDELLEAGFINLDKPPGPTSHQVVAWIKEMLNVTRAGHAGTLEPLYWGGDIPKLQVYYL